MRTIDNLSISRNCTTSPNVYMCVFKCGLVLCIYMNHFKSQLYWRRNVCAIDFESFSFLLFSFNDSIVALCLQTDFFFIFLFIGLLLRFSISIFKLNLLWFILPRYKIKTSLTYKIEIINIFISRWFDVCDHWSVL